MPRTHGRRRDAPRPPARDSDQSQGSQARSHLLPTSNIREGHPVAFLSQVQPARHLVDHRLDLVFVQRTGSGHVSVEMREGTVLTWEGLLRPSVLTSRSQQGNGPKKTTSFPSLILQQETKHVASTLPPATRACPSPAADRPVEGQALGASQH